MQNRRNIWRRVVLFLSILGPGLITVNAGNDAGGITTYAYVGATYGFKMLWGLFLSIISLAIIQEMNARMGIVTGKGLSDLIRENFGVKWTFFIMIVLFIANFGVTVGDFAGIAASLELFKISRFISVPIMAFLMWFIITMGNYGKVEKVFLSLTVVFLGYILSAFLAKPDWSEIVRNVIHPQMEFSDRNFIITLIGMIGTTITPYMQFYLQSSVVDKGLTVKDYYREKLDVIIGSFWGALICSSILISTAATLFRAGIPVNTAEEAALALRPLAGNYAFVLFALGLFGASSLAIAVIPLSTAYAVCEAFGLESGLDKNFKEAPVFYGIYTFLIAIGALLVLIPGLSLVKIILVTQQIAGILCPVILISMVLLINNRDVMGQYVNKLGQNVVAWITISFIIMLTVIYFLYPFLDAFFIKG